MTFTLRKINTNEIFRTSNSIKSTKLDAHARVESAEIFRVFSAARGAISLKTKSCRWQACQTGPSPRPSIIEIRPSSLSAAGRAFVTEQWPTRFEKIKYCAWACGAHNDLTIVCWYVCIYIYIYIWMDLGVCNNWIFSKNLGALSISRCLTRRHCWLWEHARVKKSVLYAGVNHILEW